MFPNPADQGLKRWRDKRQDVDTPVLYRSREQREPSGGRRGRGTRTRAPSLQPKGLERERWVAHHSHTFALLWPLERLKICDKFFSFPHSRDFLWGEREGAGGCLLISKSDGWGGAREGQRGSSWTVTTGLRVLRPILKYSWSSGIVFHTTCDLWAGNKQSPLN